MKHIATIVVALAISASPAAAGWHHHHAHTYNGMPPLISPQPFPCHFETPTLNCQWSGRQTWFNCTPGGSGDYRIHDRGCAPPF